MNSQFERKSLSQKLKTKFESWCKNTTAHAIPHVIESSNWFLKIMWLIFFLVGFAYCLYLLIQSFVQYFNYSVSVSIQRIQETPIVFPAITICNLNPFNDNAYKYFKRNNLSNSDCFSDDYVINGSLFQTCFDTNDTSQNFINFIESAKRLVASESKLDIKERFSLGYGLDSDMLISCSFNGLTCDEKNFTRSWNNEYGICYTINSDNHLISSITGNKNGLNLELVVIPEDQETRLALETGLYLIVHNQSEKAVTFKQGINIKTGANTYVAIQRQFTQKQSSPYSTCLIDLSYFKNLNSYSGVLYGYFSLFDVTYYDQNFCQKVCYQDKLIKNCSCSSIVTPPIPNTHYCLGDLEVQCLDEFTTFFSTADLNALCESACLEKCDVVEYQTSITMSNFPSLTYLRNLRSGYKTNLFPKNYSISDTELISFAQQGFLKVVINYDTLYYISITERPQYSIYDLIGLIGGQLGLCLGISLLFVAELIDFLVRIFILFINHRKEATN